MPQFKVLLDEIKLDPEQSARVNQAVQRAVLAELASIDTRGDQTSVIIRKLGPEIFGLIAHPISDLARFDPGRLQELDERFEQGF